MVAFLIFAILAVYFLSSTELYLSGKSSWKYPCLGFLSAAGLTFFMPHPDVARRGAFIGTVLGTGCMIAVSSYLWSALGLYLIALAVFHLSEYILTALYNRSSLSNDSFILNHSFEYHVAIAASLLEFFVETWLFPFMKSSLISQCSFYVGIVLVIGGETCRKMAMITAKSNFSHIVQDRKVDGHQLVTTGIYQISRHPSYFGWFFWSIG